MRVRSPVVVVRKLTVVKRISTELSQDRPYLHDLLNVSGVCTENMSVANANWV